MKYVVAIGGPILFVLLLLAASVLFRAQPPAPGTGTSSTPSSLAAVAGTPTPITIYSGQPCLDFTAVGSTKCDVSGANSETTAEFAVTSHCSSDETIETIFAYEVHDTTTGGTLLASWDPIQNIKIAPGQTVNVQHKISKSVPDTDTYHFSLVILNQKGPLKAEFTTEEADICRP